MDVSNYQLSINNYQLPEGYKQTEVGVIPEDWDVNELSNLTQAKRPISYGIVQTGRSVQGGVACIRVVDINNGTIDDKDLITTSEEISNSYKRTILDEGDLIIALRGKIGELAVIPKNLEGANLTRGVALIALQEGYSSRFYQQYLSSTESKIRLQNSLNGSALQELPIATVRSFFVAVPPLPEQRAIAQALSDVDALIAALDKLIAKQRHLKTATMQQLLTGKNRLPEFGGEWTEKQIGPEIDLLTGFPFPSAQYFDSGIKLLRGSNIKRGVTDWSDDLVQYWPEVTSDISQYVLNEGDIVVAMDGSLVGRSFARLSKDDLPALLLQRVARIRSDKIDMGYLKEWVCSKFFTEHCDAVKTVTAIPHISPGDIRSFVIQVPPTQEEQRAIATVLSDMDGAIAALEARRAKTQAIKQGMMQQLLTGKVRLTIESAIQ